MRSMTINRLTPGLLPLLGMVMFLGCHFGGNQFNNAQVEQYEDRMVAREFDPVPEPTAIDAPPPVELMGRVATTQPSDEAVL